MSEKKISRRRYTKYAGAGVVVVAAAGVGAYYYSQRAPAVKKMDLKALTFDFDWAVHFHSKVSEAYQQHTEGNVTMTSEMYPYDALHPKIVTELSSKSTAYDIYNTDCIWVGEIVGNDWGHSLAAMKEEDPSLPDINWDIFTDAAKVYPRFNANAELAALPTNNSNQVLCYRKDLFEEYGIGRPPKNWDEYREVAKSLTLDTTGDGNIDLYGTMLLQADQDAGYSDWTFRLFGNGPFETGQTISDGFVFNDEGEPIFGTVGRDASIEALDRLHEVLPYCPPGTLGYSYPDSSLAYYEGKTAMILTWNDTFADAETPEISKVAGKNAYTPIPYDHENWQSVGMAGPLWINKFITPERAKAAYEFMAWMTSDGGIAYDLMAEPGGTVAPCIKRHLNDPDILKRLPVAAAYKEIKNFVPIPVYWAEFFEIQRIIWEEVSLSLAGKKTSAEAIDEAYSRSKKAMA